MWFGSLEVNKNEFDLMIKWYKIFLVFKIECRLCFVKDVFL